MDLPVSVLQLIKSYDVAALQWDRAEDRYAIVREILDRGSPDAWRWLHTQLTREDTRRLLCEFRGAGFDEPARARLRAEYNLTTEDIPVRAFIAWSG
jgi:hypothetical protein